MSQNENASRCSLLGLPNELQVAIYELVIVADEPLLLNCPCDASYRGRKPELAKEEKAWKSGERKAPSQPALALTCHSIRNATLPIFYGENVFRAAYCKRHRSTDGPIEWLRAIGQKNRELLKHMYFYDRRQDQDRQHVRDLVDLEECELFRNPSWEGEIREVSSKACCAHLARFGAGRQLWQEVPVLAEEEEVPRLRCKGER